MTTSLIIPVHQLVRIGVQLTSGTGTGVTTGTYSELLVGLLDWNIFFFFFFFFGKLQYQSCCGVYSQPLALHTTSRVGYLPYTPSLRYYKGMGNVTFSVIPGKKACSTGSDSLTAWATRVRRWWYKLLQIKYCHHYWASLWTFILAYYVAPVALIILWCGGNSPV